MPLFSMQPHNIVKSKRNFIKKRITKRKNGYKSSYRRAVLLRQWELFKNPRRKRLPTDNLVLFGSERSAGSKVHFQGKVRGVNCCAKSMIRFPYVGRVRKGHCSTRSADSRII